MAPFLFLENFLHYLEVERRFSGHTLVAYKKDLTQFLEFLNLEDLSQLQETPRAHLRGWIRNLSEANCTNKTIVRKLSALRSFSRYLKKETGNPIKHLSKIQGPKVEKRLPQFVKVSELKEHALPTELNFENVRDYLLVEMLYQTGIRLSELIDLREANVQRSTIKVLGKRNKERLIPIGPSLFQVIEMYRKEKKKAGIEHPCLFVLNSGKKLYPKFVYRKINIYLGEVTVMDKKSPHVLRHTFATHLLNNGAGLESLKELLGHANLSATQVYTHNSFAQLSNIYSQAHPRGRKTD